jgi:hypothetical protein
MAEINPDAKSTSDERGAEKRAEGDGQAIEVHVGRPGQATFN